ncbi:SGNH/GDSL hydrolase family protein [Bacillus sp. B-jedd]|uniref:SGNH/GDSL hydrolase family protein n=1 Tax=Bacillus sp. B-jedd TaxID=1476857 RepID=UPI0005156C85|nr:SGNH/GDSL hydrolase family protein [Bacillus sp. B-jedd]CEG27536.1 GDSL-like Lipase/Acylhydrolase [Bacillus sp. B-jedd]
MKKPFPKILYGGLAGVIVLFLFINQFTFAKGSRPATEGFFNKLNNGENYNYLVIGDSIGRGSGAEARNGTWFSQFERRLKDIYGSGGSRFSIVQSGATAFEGIMKYGQEKPNVQVDLVIIVFGENDRKYMDAGQFAFFYEKLIRQVKLDHPTAALFTFTESCLKNEDFAKVIQDVSARYGAANIDMRIPFAASSLTAAQLTKDGIHPNQQGYQLYAEEILKTVTRLEMEKDHPPLPLPAPMHEGLANDYVVNANPSAMKGFSKKGKGFFANEKGAFLEFSFTGTMVGYKLDRVPAGALIDVFIDGKPAGSLTTWWPFKKERTIYVASSLKDGSHLIRFVHSGKATHPSDSGIAPSIFIKGIITEKSD